MDMCVYERVRLYLRKNHIHLHTIAKQSGIYFLIISVMMLPIAYVTNWMKHTVLGVLSYAGIFVAIFVVVWLSQFLLWKRTIRKMNALVGKEEEQKGGRGGAELVDAGADADDQAELDENQAPHGP